jgi:hypothetical protein
MITTPTDLVKWSNDVWGSNTVLNAELYQQMVTGIPTNEEQVSYG